MKVFIIIPAYNEAKSLARVLLELTEMHPTFEIIVVDDGSLDATYQIACKYATTLRHAINRGQGASLATGTRYALSQGADIIVHYDADGQFSAGDVHSIIQPLKEDRADIVFGSRFLRKNSIPWTKKNLILKPAILLRRLFTASTLTDIHNGFRALNRTAAQSIIITQDRMAHPSEIASKVRLLQLRYSEVPVTVYYHEYGQGLLAGLKIYKDILIKKILKS